MRPLIGIPPCLDEQGRWRRSREYHYADAAYARAVAEAGGLPIYLPLQGALRIVRERSTGDFTATSHAETATATTTVDLTYLYGWSGERIVRLTAAGSQTLTLPSYGVANNVPVGCTLKVVNRSAATKTISAAAAELIVGAGAAALTFALAANSSAEFFFDGAQWAVT